MTVAFYVVGLLVSTLLGQYVWKDLAQTQANSHDIARIEERVNSNEAIDSEQSSDIKALESDIKRLLSGSSAGNREGSDVDIIRPANFSDNSGTRGSRGSNGSPSGYDCPGVYMDTI